MGAILTHMLGCKTENNQAHIQCPLKGFLQKIFSFFRTKPEAPYYSLKTPVSSTVKLNKHLNNLIDASNALDNELQQLTREEKKFINKSWHSFMKLPPTNSVNTFVMFLQENPKYRKFFKSVDGIPLEDLQYNFRMPEPIIGIFLYVNSMIHCLENADAMFFLSLQVGLLHSDKGLAVEDFKLFKKYVIKILQDELGLSEEGTSVWNKVLDIFMSVFYVGVNVCVTFVATADKLCKWNPDACFDAKTDWVSSPYLPQAEHKSPFLVVCTETQPVGCSLCQRDTIPLKKIAFKQ